MTLLSGLDPDVDLADDFWASTALDESSNDRFVRRLRLDRAEPAVIHALASARAPIPLRPVDDRFQRGLARRRSRRAFGRRPMTTEHVARLLAAVGETDTGRLIPSAGGLDVLSTFVIPLAVSGPAGDATTRYDARRHALAPVGTPPSTEELAEWCNLDPETDGGSPAAVLVLVADLRPLRRRYGTRGDRFALVGTGCALQNLELRAAKDRLAAHQLGGAREELRAVLGLPDPDVRITGALAVGRRAR